ncbi:MAG TPA: hypothetical protein VEI54_03790 [Candidatus Limnocylindrales bacterium]|nr:hypothetical protein [Candidatus Limnocylindrales bacterium]
MPNPVLLPCDGCGQLVGLPHISRRLQRLEWATRFRPVHVHALLLGGIAPESDDEFLYAPQSSFQGEARSILDAVQISTEGKSPESVLSEFQRLGLALTHVLECPLDPDTSEAGMRLLMEKQLPAAIARIRRSLKPKRVLLFSPELSAVVEKLHQSHLDCQVLPPAPSIFLAAGFPAAPELEAFREALISSRAHSA